MTNTLVAFKKLVANGMDKQLAEAVTEIIEDKQDSLVTKSDLKVEMAETRSEISEVKADIKWLKGIGLVIVGLLIKVAFL